MRHWIVIALLLSACSDDAVPDHDAPLSLDAPRLDGGQPDGPSRDAPSPDGGGLAALTCKQLSDQAFPLMNALDHTCNGDDDCEIVNLPTAPPDCDRMHILGGNDRAARKGWTDADLTALRTEFFARCQSSSSCGSDNPCIADWRPPLARCQSHSCVAVLQSCLPLPPDAGP
jgi:hypothetical protein